VSKFHRRLVVLLTMFATLEAAPAFTQSPKNLTSQSTPQTSGEAPSNVPPPRFDVISIKPSKTTVGGMGLAQSTADGISIINTTAKLLIANAYGVKQDLVSGGPSWVGSSEFDIDAKVLPAEGATPLHLDRRQLKEMTKALLADRFELKVHAETRELPVYQLTLAKGGSKLKEAQPGDTYPNGVKGPDGKSHAGMMMMLNGRFIGQGIALSGLIDTLSLVLHRPVIDKTGLSGKYDITLTLPRDEPNGTPLPPPVGADASPANVTSESSNPSFFTTIEEQLGLRLESAKGPVEVLVIDHIEKPSAN
jgi:uncharacterized protein (TIGR03435 family)